MIRSNRWLIDRLPAYTFPFCGLFSIQRIKLTLNCRKSGGPDFFEVLYRNKNTMKSKVAQIQTKVGVVPYGLSTFAVYKLIILFQGHLMFLCKIKAKLAVF